MQEAFIPGKGLMLLGLFIGRFNGVDPVSASFESWTTYHYSYNNPVNFNDPMGDYAVSEGWGSNYRVLKSWEVADRIMIANGWGELTGNDWTGDSGGGGDIRFGNAKELFEYVQKMGTNSVNTSFGGLYADAFGVYDMSLSDVSNAWRYLGELGITPGYSKNEKPIIRKDGSRMFRNENEAYNWMYKQSINNNYREVLAIVLENSVLVLPDYKNTSTESTPENYGYSWKDGNIYDPVTQTTFITVATIHTHLKPDKYYFNAPNGADQTYFGSNTPNKPYLTMAKDGYIYGNYGAKKNGVLQSTQISFNRAAGVERITNSMVMKSFALRGYLQWYMKNVAKIK